MRLCGSQHAAVLSSSVMAGAWQCPCARVLAVRSRRGPTCAELGGLQLRHGTAGMLRGHGGARPTHRAVRRIGRPAFVRGVVRRVPSRWSAAAPAQAICRPTPALATASTRRPTHPNRTPQLPHCWHLRSEVPEASRRPARDVDRVSGRMAVARASASSCMRCVTTQCHSPRAFYHGLGCRRRKLQ